MAPRGITKRPIMSLAFTTAICPQSVNISTDPAGRRGTKGRASFNPLKTRIGYYRDRMRVTEN
jgi:hypothetical protein